MDGCMRLASLRSPGRWFLAALICASAIVLSPASPASAHASLVGSDPSYGSTVTVAPTTVKLLFDNLVEPGLVKVRLKNEAGEEIGKGELVGERTPRADVEFTLPAHDVGSFSISWVSFAFDGHVVSGTVPYTVDPNATAATLNQDAVAPPEGSGSGSTNRVIDIVEIQLRFLSYVAMAALFGALLWAALLRARDGAAIEIMAKASAGAIFPAAMAASALAILRGAVGAWRLVDGGYEPSALVRLLWDGQLGGYLLAAALFAAVWDGTNRTRQFAFGAAGAALTAALGHAASAPAPGIGSMLMAAHLVVAATWVGSVSLLAYVSTDKAFGAIETRWAELRPALNRLGALLWMGVGVLAITGLRAAAVYGDGLPDGRWGITLAGKLVLVVAGGGIGLTHYVAGRSGRALRPATLVAEATLLVLATTAAAVLSVTTF